MASVCRFKRSLITDPITGPVTAPPATGTVPVTAAITATAIRLLSDPATATRTDTVMLPDADAVAAGRRRITTIARVASGSMAETSRSTSGSERAGQEQPGRVFLPHEPPLWNLPLSRAAALHLGKRTLCPKRRREPVAMEKRARRQFSSAASSQCSYSRGRASCRC